MESGQRAMFYTSKALIQGLVLQIGNQDIEDIELVLYKWNQEIACSLQKDAR
jgi:hypothetical protein